MSNDNQIDAVVIKSETNENKQIPVCSVQRLARFFTNKLEEKSSNYSMLLGSGCSISSNIRSGEQLIKEWKKQVYSELKGGIDEKDDLESFFMNNEKLTWYDPLKPYQSLFAHLYPLKEHRRKFVEKEIERSDVLPGIGYAILVRLARQFYVDSFFTTNFDDLINEAFYVYGGFSFLRPVVCSHESSIDSISIYTSRPKIIKLHGDYLFENIQTTAKETEELGDNSKHKFAEFAKEKGLIIIGYSGNDNSIMKALNELAADHKNFKNGVFWCVRKGSEISSRVHEFIDKCNEFDQRAWIIYIDGFDEFMCELSHYIDPNGKPLSFSPIVETDSSKRINDFYNNNPYYINTKSDFLRIQYESLKKSLKNEMDDDTPDALLKDEEYKSQKPADFKFSKINGLLDSKNYEDAVIELEKLDQSKLSSNDYYEYHQLLAFANYKVNQNAKTIAILNKLIEKRPFDTQNYFNLSLVYGSFDEKCAIIEKGLQNNPTSISLLSRKSDILITEYNRLIDVSSERNSEIERTLLQGIKLSNAIDNNCWLRLFEYYFKQGKTNNDFSQCEALLSGYEERFPNDYSVVYYHAKLMKAKKEKPSCILEYIHNHRTEGNRDFDLFDSLLAQYCFDASTYKEAFDFLVKKYDYRSASTVIDKASLIFEKLRNPDKAISLLKKYLEKNNSIKVVRLLIEYLLTIGDVSEAEELIKQNDIVDKDLEISILENRNEWVVISEKYKIELEKNPNDERLIMGYSHALLKTGNNKDAMRFLQDKLEGTGFSNLRMLINYTLAKNETRKNTKKTDISRLENLTSLEDESLETIASLLICGKKREAIELLTKIITRDYTDYYYMRKMFVFENYLSDDDWQMVLEKIPKTREIEDDVWSQIMSSV